MTKNEDSTRYYSNLQESYVAKKLGGHRCANSGAGHWKKQDVIVSDANLGIECKTVTSPKRAFSIKKEWIEKSKEEALANRLSNTALAISFEPEGTENYYLINEKLMKFLVEKLSEEQE